jgi:hypothetical protein
LVTKVPVAVNTDRSVYANGREENAMCPVCLATTALITAGISSIGGVAPLLAFRLTPQRRPETSEDNASRRNQDPNKFGGDGHE